MRNIVPFLFSESSASGEPYCDNSGVVNSTAPGTTKKPRDTARGFLDSPIKRDQYFEIDGPPKR